MRAAIRLATGLLAVGLVPTALAAPDAEAPAKAVRRAAKELQGLRSYRVDVTVTGGKARGKEHRVYEETVNEAYRAEVLGKVARIAAPEAFRLRFDSTKGAIHDGGRWLTMLTTDSGRLVARLFEPAEKHLAEAVRFKRTARWIAPEGGAPGPGPVVSSEDDDPEEGTAERDGPSSAGRDEAPPPSHHLRVVGPVEVALEHFITITNSGCFSEG